MQPSFRPGDVAVVQHVGEQNACQAIGHGDVITFMPYPNDPTLVTHRVVGVSMTGAGCQFLTQGDANNSPDPRPVAPAQVRGRVIYRVPMVGHAAEWAHANQPLVLTVVGVGLLVWLVADPARKALANRRRPTGAPVPDEIVTQLLYGPPLRIPIEKWTDELLA
jgi:signal peptidase